MALIKLLKITLPKQMLAAPMQRKKATIRWNLDRPHTPPSDMVDVVVAVPLAEEDREERLNQLTPMLLL